METLMTNMKNADRPVYPAVNAQGAISTSEHFLTKNEHDHFYLTKREYFAAMAMQSMVAGEGARMVADRDGRYNGTNWKEVVSMNAVEFADALLKQLQQ